MSTDFNDYEKIKERHTGGNGQDFEDWNEPPADICLSLQQWIERVVPPDDYLMGEFLSTTSRMLLVATTGLGKTSLCLAWAMAIVRSRRATTRTSAPTSSKLRNSPPSTRGT